MKIKRAVCEHFKVSHGDLISERRQKYIILPRQIAMFLCKAHTSATLPAIGRAFGGRDHTTALHACRKIEDLVLSRADPEVSKAVTALRVELDGIL